MSFTERDLRAMLEENSAAPPPTGDLAAAAEERGRRIRRRRATAGAVAATALVTLGFAVTPSLLPEERSRDVVAAATSEPTDSKTRPDVDLSLLEKREIPLSLASGIGNVEIVDSDDPVRKQELVQTPNHGLVSVTDLRVQALLGTVEGFEMGTEAITEGEKARGINLKVRAHSLVNGSDGLEASGLREGETATFNVGAADPASYPIDKLNRAIPAGTRVLLYEQAPGSGFALAEQAGVFFTRSVVLEDADGTPVGGPYTEGLQSGVWQRAKSFGELLKLGERLEYTCALVRKETDPEAKPDSPRALDLETKPCLRVSWDAPSPKPTPGPSTSATVTPSPAAP